MTTETVTQSDLSTPAADDETHVAAFGCPFAGRLFRALLPGPPPHSRSKAPLTIPACPGCGDEHGGMIYMGRERLPSDVIDICIGGAVDSGAPTKRKARRRRAPTPSAEQVLAAIPTTPTPPPDMTPIAATLGYVDLGALRQRLKRMNAAAEACGESPPFVFERVFGAGQQTTIRRRNVADGEVKSTHEC